MVCRTALLPYLATIVAISVTTFSGNKIYKLRIKLERLEQGRDGEKVVGQFLDNLKSSDYRVFHDIVGDNFNIDHVVICEHGVFTVETKTYSKPESGSAVVLVEDERVIVDSYPSDKIAIQAKAQASWLQKIIYKATEKKIKVQPTVLFPGWYVDSTKATKNIWFLHPEQLPAWIKNHKKVLSHDEVVNLTYCISQYIKTR